jgi:recombining binding protein suppressor of hairless
MLMNNGMRPDPRNESLVTIYGENFSKTDPPLLFFGTELSPFVDVRCQEVLACIPPPLPSLAGGGAPVNGNGVDPSRVAIESGGVPPQSSAPRPIFIARADGVIYPSSILFYSQ